MTGIVACIGHTKQASAGTAVRLFIVGHSCQVVEEGQTVSSAQRVLRRKIEVYIETLPTAYARSSNGEIYARRVAEGMGELKT